MRKKVGCGIQKTRKTWTTESPDKPKKQWAVEKAKTPTKQRGHNQNEKHDQHPENARDVLHH